MTTGIMKETAKQQIKELLDKYQRVVAENKISKYNEEMTKISFILPLFRALGWNIEDSNEVTAEEQVSKRRVDFGFRLNGIPKFFLEAKPMKADLTTQSYIEQAIDYAWTKGCTWAVLTDFEDIMIFNAEWKTQNLLHNQLKSIKCHEFLERFDELWLLSKESFQEDIIDKVAEKWGKKAKLAPIDQQLLDDFAQWRSSISSNILKFNKEMKLTEEELDEAVHRLMNRLVFIRKTEDAELEPNILLSTFREWDGDRKKSLYSKLIEIFRKFEETYDSELFKEALIDQVTITSDTLKDMITGLYRTKDKLRRYDFEIIDADVLGNIYEQYLSHILKKTEKKAKITVSQTLRKEQGIYYTPTYIVDYIVRNTLGEMIKTKKNNAEKIRVLDPACGSGSFLIKAFDILNAHYSEDNENYAQTNLDLKTGAPFTTRVNILQNNLFGVDLDKQAVEIAQLNLLLKIAERRHRLPLLQENIQYGNSLIDDKSVAGNKAFIWNERFEKIMEEGGFDVVIGNPPYINAIQLTKTVGEEIKKYWKSKYYSAKGAYDIFVLFFEQSLNVCKNNGFVSFITPNKYLSSPYGKALRELISKKYKLVKVLDLSKVRVFDDPSVYPIITIIQKKKPEKDYTIITEKIFSEDMNDKKCFKISSKNLTLLPDFIWGVILSDNMEIIEKIFRSRKSLVEIAKVQATSTASEADEYSKYLNEINKGLPIINTGTIDRYNTSYGTTKFVNKGKQRKRPCLDITKIKDNRRELYKSPKIIIAKLALRIEGFFDDVGSYASINTNCIHSPKNNFPLEYLTGIINSKLLSFIYSELFSGLKMRGGYFQFQAPQLRILPIAETSEAQRNKVIDSVRKMLSLNKRLNEIGNKKTDERARIEGEIKKTDDEIDDLVYNIYGLTDSEKEIVRAN